MVRLRQAACFLLLLPCTLITSQGQDLLDPECSIFIRQHEHHFLLQERRRPATGNLSRPPPPPVHAAWGRPGLGAVAVAPSAEGITVVWQESGLILLRRFGHDCRSRGYSCIVSSSRNFANGGLGGSAGSHSHALFDEASLPMYAAASKGVAAPATDPADDLGSARPGGTAPPSQSGPLPNTESEVTLGDISALKEGRTVVAWMRDGDVWISVVHEDAGPPVRASGNGRFQRRDVAVTATPDGNGFVVAWSALGQDGDGWGLAARVFGSDGQPVGEEQLVNSGWRGSQQHPQLIACVSGAAGPAVWALWGNGTGNSSHELFVRRLTNGGLWAPAPELPASDARHFNESSSLVLNSVTLMCATGSSTEDPTIVWSTGQPGHNRHVLWRRVGDTKQGNAGNTSVFITAPPSRQFLKKNNHSKALTNSSNSSLTHEKLHFAKPQGTMLLRAEGDVLAVASEDFRGGLSVQLFDMMPTSPYPAHQMMISGSILQQIAYDVTPDQALIVCWSHPSGLSCERRHLQALMEHESEQMSWWFIIIIFVVFFWCRHEFASNGFSDTRRIQPLTSSSTALALNGMRQRLYLERASDTFHPRPQSAWRLRQQAKFI